MFKNHQTHFLLFKRAVRDISVAPLHDFSSYTPELVLLEFSKCLHFIQIKYSFDTVYLRSFFFFFSEVGASWPRLTIVPKELGKDRHPLDT